MDKKYLKYLQQFTGNKIVEVNLEYYEKDICALYSYIKFIEYLIDKKEKVPTRVLKKVIKIFKTPIIDDYKNNIELIDKYRNKALELICDLPLYDFKIIVNSKDLNTNKYVKKVYTFTDFLYQHLPNILQSYTQNKDVNQIIKSTFKELHSYLRNIPKSKQFNLYKYTIISGILCVTLGELYTENEYIKSKHKDSTYTQYLHNKTKYVCKNEKSKLIPKKVAKKPTLNSGLNFD